MGTPVVNFIFGAVMVVFLLVLKRGLVKLLLSDTAVRWTEEQAQESRARADAAKAAFVAYQAARAPQVDEPDHGLAVIQASEVL